MRMDDEALVPLNLRTLSHRRPAQRRSIVRGSSAADHIRPPGSMNGSDAWTVAPQKALP